MNEYEGKLPLKDIRRYILEGKQIEGRGDFYRELQQLFAAPDFSGSNLDAFYEIAVSRRYGWTLLLQNSDQVKFALGQDYWQRFRRTCAEIMRARNDVVVLMGYEGSGLGRCVQPDD